MKTWRQSSRVERHAEVGRVERHVQSGHALVSSQAHGHPWFNFLVYDFGLAVDRFLCTEISRNCLRQTRWRKVEGSHPTPTVKVNAHCFRGRLDPVIDSPSMVSGEKWSRTTHANVSTVFKTVSSPARVALLVQAVGREDSGRERTRTSRRLAARIAFQASPVPDGILFRFRDGVPRQEVARHTVGVLVRPESIRNRTHLPRSCGFPQWSHRLVDAVLALEISGDMRRHRAATLGPLFTM